jgi:two-component system sensor histidine kinase VicK
LNYNGNSEKNDLNINNSNEDMPISDKTKKRFAYNSSSISNNIDNSFIEESTKIVYGEEETTKTILHALNNSQERWDTYANSKGPTIAMGLEPLRKGIKNAYSRGIKIRYISEITPANINYCKELMKMAEVRHLDNSKGGMAVSETEYIATAHLQEAKPVQHLIYSNAKEIVEQQQLVFESLWNNAIPAEKRIKEIEEGYDRIETRVFDNWFEIYEKIKSLTKNSEEILVCSHVGLLRIVYDSLFDVYQDIMDKYDKGYHKGVRWITSISSKEDLETVKLFMDIGIKIRIIKNLYPINYMICDKVFFSNVDEIINSKERKIIDSMLVSNDDLYIKQFKILFEDLWMSSVDAHDIIDDIGRGIDPEKIDVILRSSNAESIYLNLLKSASKEIMLIFPTSNAFLRQYKIGVHDLLIDAVVHRYIKIRVLVPKNPSVLQLIDQIKNQCILLNKNKNKNKHNNNDTVDFRHIQQLLDTRSTILIVDKKVSFVMELKDDTKQTFHEAIGLSTHSNSKAGVISYVSIFENIWNQTELYYELEKANENLRNSERLQRDFIHIAAHELRNPIQPILGISEILKAMVNNDEYSDLEKVWVDKKEINDLINIIIKNTKKLSRLATDILDLTKIETGSLILYKEIVDLRSLLLDHIDDYKNKVINNLKTQYQYNNNDTFNKNNRDNVRLIISSIKDLKDKYVSFLTEADRSRISQVITNLLDNAFKFTDKNDSIYIKLKRELYEKQKYAIITIKDTGKGIDPEIMPRLFTKFTSRSFKGTGLGLYICKSIVEAHGGKIWAENNKDGIGATFSFSLPLINNKTEGTI